MIQPERTIEQFEVAEVIEGLKGEISPDQLQQFPDSYAVVIGHEREQDGVYDFHPHTRFLFGEQGELKGHEAVGMAGLAVYCEWILYGYATKGENGVSVSGFSNELNRSVAQTVLNDLVLRPQVENNEEISEAA